MTRRQELIDFLDSIRDYERESHNMIGFDERTSGEFVDQYLADHPKLETERSCKSCRHRYKSDLNCGHCDLSIFSNWKSQKQVERSCKTCGIPESTYWHPRCHGCGEEYNHWKPKI